MKERESSGRTTTEYLVPVAFLSILSLFVLEWGGMSRTSAALASLPCGVVLLALVLLSLKVTDRLRDGRRRGDGGRNPPPIH